MEARVSPPTQSTGQVIPFGLAFAEKTPPHSVEAEIAILGGLLIDPEAIARILDKLPPEAFYLSSNRLIFQAVLAVHTAHKMVDPVAVLTQLRESATLEKIGGQSVIMNLVANTVSAVNVDLYAEMIVDKWHRRQIISAGHQIVATGYSQEELPDLCNQAEQAIFTVTQGTQTQGTLAKAGDIAIAVFDRIEAVQDGRIQPGIPTGFYDLDSMTKGFQRSDLIIVAARPAMGKSAFATNVAESVATNGRNVILFSLEMDREQILTRMIASRSRVDSGRLREGQVAAQEWEPLGHTLSQVATLPFWVDDFPNPTCNHIASTCRRHVSEFGHLDLIVIDYLQLIQGDAKGGENRVQELSKITRSLKSLARALKVPIVALSQLSRAVETRTNKRPMMSDLRESGSIEQDADLIMMLYRDEYYHPDTPDRGIAELIITKHRNGPVGTVKLLFESQFTQFRNLARRS
jgi:replicative DNA helicase